MSCNTGLTCLPSLRLSDPDPDPDSVPRSSDRYLLHHHSSVMRSWYLSPAHHLPPEMKPGWHRLSCPRAIDHHHGFTLTSPLSLADMLAPLPLTPPPAPISMNDERPLGRGVYRPCDQEAGWADRRVDPTPRLTTTYTRAWLSCARALSGREREHAESRVGERERENPNRATECKWGEVRDSRLKLYIGEREEEQLPHQGCMCVLENEEDSS